MYRYCEPNPKGRNIIRCDGAVRAIAVAFDISYSSAITKLCEYAISSCNAPEDILNFKYMLKREKWSYNSNKGKECSTVAEFADTHNAGTFILRCNKKHYCTVIDGCYCDAWDSGDMKVHSYWQKGE